MRMGLSSDGTTLAYAGVDLSGASRIWTVSLRNGTVREVEGAANGFGPVWSPDGSQLAYTLRQAGANVSRRIAVAGGVPEILAPFGGPRTWSPTGALIFAGPGRNMQWIDTKSGVTTKYNSEASLLRSTMFLPDGRRFLMGEFDDSNVPIATSVASLDSTERTKLIDGSALAFYAPGAIAYVRGAMLIAQQFDEQRLALVGQPITLAEGIDQSIAGGYAVAAAPVGTIVLQRPDAPGRSQLQWLGRDGTVTATVGEAADYSNVELSPDGRRLLGRSPMWRFAPATSTSSISSAASDSG